MQQVSNQQDCWKRLYEPFIVDAKKELGEKNDHGAKSEGEEETGNTSAKAKSSLGRTPNHLTLR